MSGGLFASVAGVCFVTGLAWSRWQAVLGALVLWVIGLGVAGLVGAFEPTTEDNTLAMFFMTGIPTLIWVVAFGLGTLTRRMFIESRAPRSRP